MAGGFLSLTALRAEGCGLPCRAMLIKSALRDLSFCVIWHDEHSGDWLTAFATKKGGAADAAGCVEGLWKKVLKMDRPTAGGFLSLTALRAEGCGLPCRAMLIKSALRDLSFCVIWHDEHSGDWLTAFATKKGGAADAAGCVEGLWKKVLKMDRPTAGGFLSLTALRAEGCGLPCRAILMKSALRDLSFCIIWHDEHYGNQPPPVAFPPLVAGATTFPPRWEACHLILSRLRLPANQVPLPPRSGGTIKLRKAILS